jgi:hypothetical protein
VHDAPYLLENAEPALEDANLAVNLKWNSIWSISWDGERLDTPTLEPRSDGTPRQVAKRRLLPHLLVLAPRFSALDSWGRTRRRWNLDLLGAEGGC